MPYWAYLVIHMAGIAWLFASLGALVVHALNGGSKGDNRARKLVAMSHGIGLLLILVSGFGMLAKLGLMTSFPGWVWIKWALWLAAGALVALPYRKPELARLVWFTLPILAAIGAWLGFHKGL